MTEENEAKKQLETNVPTTAQQQPEELKPAEDQSKKKVVQQQASQNVSRGNSEAHDKGKPKKIEFQQLEKILEKKANQGTEVGEDG